LPFPSKWIFDCCLPGYEYANYGYYPKNNNKNYNYNYGETFQTTTEIPGTYEQTYQGTTNVIDGNNYFGDTIDLLNNATTSNVIQGTNIDLNSYFNTNNNADTNIIYGQTQFPQTTTTTTTTATTTTDYNTIYGPNQTIQGTTT